MKKLFILSAIALSGLAYNTADAQIGFHGGFRFHAPRVIIADPTVAVQPAAYVQPADTYYQDQAPAYDTTADDYYYLPDVDAYYDVTDQCYFYFDGSAWISAAYLPGAYENFDWRTARRFEVRAARPYLNDNFYRSRYNGRQVAEFARTNYDNRSNGGYANQGYRDNAQNAYNRGAERPAQPVQYNQGYRDNAQNTYNRGAERPAQPVQFNRGNANKPAPQNNNGQRYDNRSQDTRGGSEHFAQSNPQNGASRRMSKF